ncbi:Transcriptional regulator, CRP/FNR family protein [Pseudooceanicola batsensis HTCC2597]|uniref:Transcriptional regulator, CRP/FNR family protein n=1 Tax=Pseudooceanicola batsensis (strain ATCC BAA-863 / DSM 15984 / KCTC 12145 / HTCC2597) TaxID=252305 RepID=A3U422_PSEBH|nr:Crp/Fnr family transcriptional regulator [Pseudooceanicola batsensis]EAQ01069.1 Transcriptional regulator, CRP/FNR family protein [Pseudooceanicola batsensis HTCC2597]
MQRMTRYYGQNGNGGGHSPASCFASRLERYAPLTDEEKGFVARMEEAERPVKRGEVVLKAGEPSTELGVVKEGWAVARSDRLNGRSQTLRIYLPGEIIGLPGLGIGHYAHEVVMVTQGCICPFPKDHITGIYARVPRLAALLTAVASVDQVALKDRLFMMGSGTARERMAHFLLDLHERLLLSNPDMGRRFRLPLRQVDIAEVLGLTKVYVNRLLKAFTEEGLIEIQRPYVRILRPAELKSMSNYVNRYEQIDQSWFPSPARNDISL